MKKDGFTLIELLAVIVILAIIALIATPIVLNIIQETRNSARQRSAEFAGSAMEYAVASYLSHNNGMTDGLDLDTIASYFSADNIEYVKSGTEYQIKEKGIGGIKLCDVSITNGNIIVNCGEFATTKTIPYTSDSPSNSETANDITFTIQGVGTFQATEGMTWEDWILSSGESQTDNGIVWIDTSTKELYVDIGNGLWINNIRNQYADDVIESTTYRVDGPTT